MKIFQYQITMLPLLPPKVFYPCNTLLLNLKHLVPSVFGQKVPVNNVFNRNILHITKRLRNATACSCNIPNNHIVYRIQHPAPHQLVDFPSEVSLTLRDKHRLEKIHSYVTLMDPPPVGKAVCGLSLRKQLFLNFMGPRLRLH